MAKASRSTGKKSVVDEVDARAWASVAERAGERLQHEFLHGGAALSARRPSWQWVAWAAPVFEARVSWERGAECGSTVAIPTHPAAHEPKAPSILGTGRRVHLREKCKRQLVRGSRLHDTDPETGAKLESKMLTPNRRLKSLIREFQEAQAAAAAAQEAQIAPSSTPTAES